MNKGQEKGYLTQSACMLLEYTLTSDQIEQALKDHSFSLTKYDRGTDLLTLASASVVIDVPSHLNAQSSVMIDIMSGPWPDRIPDKDQDPVQFLSWHAGAFGPYAYPGCLERALQECRTWEVAPKEVQRHTAWIRLRAWHADTTHKNDSSIPENYHAIEELAFITRLLLALDKLPGVIGYFFPGGEALCSRETLSQTWKCYLEGRSDPFDLWLMWINRRLVRVPEAPDWALIDIVGLHQIGLVDIEACFQHARYQPVGVANWLLNVANYLYNSSSVIGDGHTLTGPGGINWQAHHFENSLQFPPRQVLCVRPVDHSKLPLHFSKRLSIPKIKSL